MIETQSDRRSAERISCAMRFTPALDGRPGLNLDCHHIRGK
jgi:hypothetical protein